MRQRPIGVAEEPKTHSRKAMTGHRGVIAVERRHEAVFARVVEGDAFLEMLARCGELADTKQESAQEAMSDEEYQWVACVFGQPQYLFPKRARRLEIARTK